MKAFRNCSQILTLKSAHQKDGRKLLAQDIDVINDGAIIFDEEKIHWVGRDSDLPDKYTQISGKSLRGHVVTPELIDSHTHLIFGGNRSFEYSMRLNGADYEEIAKAGGGILSTMNATHKLTSDDLLAIASERIERIHSYGVGTIEIKSGYGLTFEKEYELSHIIDDLKKKYSKKVQILNTFMAAHAVPPNYKSSSEYLDDVVIPLLRKLSKENIIDAVDIFHERNYFSGSDTKKLFSYARELGIFVKSHADEFRDNKGAILATEYSAISTDHLLATSADGIMKLAQSNTVATLLPGTGFFLGKPQANARAMLDAGVKVALASDYNPGSCHCDNILLIASISAPTLKMNLCELWSSITLNAAHALGLRNQGAIIPEFKPRFSVFNVPTIDEITYNWGRNFNQLLDI